MKRLTPFLCLMLISCFAAFASAAPDFSGTWIRDVGRSDLMATLIDGKVTSISADLVINQTENSIQIESRWDYKDPTTENYFLGETEQRNSLVYATSWEGDKLIIQRSGTANTPFGPAEINMREEYSLSDSGNTLTVTTAARGPFGSVRKQVYHR